MTRVVTAERSALPRERVPARVASIAVRDLRDDFDELLFLARCAHRGLRDLAADLERSRGDVDGKTRKTLLWQVAAVQSSLAALVQRLVAVRARAETGTASSSLVDELAAEKASAAELVRAQQAVVAGLATAVEWQSPSFLHSRRAAAGRHGSLIRPYWNDYKRDRHREAELYEAAYVAEFHPQPQGLRALLTSCGMAAFTTILHYLLFERRLDRPVVIGRALYHETKELLVGALPRQAHIVDEADTHELVAAIRTLQPSAVFLDSLCNTSHAPVPDLAAVAAALRGSPESYLVVDNTGLPTFEPFGLLGVAPALGLIAFESLLKYAQFGTDRVNAGVIVACADDAAGLDRYREHLGTNIGDAAVHALPDPNRRALDRRLRRIERNATLVATHLERVLARMDGAVFEGVAYPGLESHPSHGVARSLPFRGGCVSLAFSRGADVAAGERFVATAIAEARLAGVHLIAGTSFGFDVTRVYLTASRSSGGEPFVRVAAGTEHIGQARAVARVLGRAVRTRS